MNESKDKLQKLLLLSLILGIFVGSIVNMIISWLIYTKKIDDSKDKIDIHKRNLIIAGCILFVGGFTLPANVVLFFIFMALSLISYGLSLKKENSYIQAITWSSICAISFIATSFF